MNRVPVRTPTADLKIEKKLKVEFTLLFTAFSVDQQPVSGPHFKQYMEYSWIKSLSPGMLATLNRKYLLSISP